MANRNPRKSHSEPLGGSISEHTSDWIRRFVEQVERLFVETCHDLPSDARILDYHAATIRAILQALQETGLDNESIAEMVGQLLTETGRGPIEWNSTLNQLRFELIDKEIQGTLTPIERIQLAGLTRIMREQLESEASLPMKGAKALHRKLLEKAAEDRPN